MKIDILVGHLSGKPSKWCDLKKDCGGHVPANGVIAFKKLYKTHPAYRKLTDKRLSKKINKKR
jgi:hypothetical protein